MSSFSFLSSYYLFGLAAAAIPLVIHLSRSRRTKKMRFSTTRFFTDQFLRSSRMSRLKEVVLLAFRMALFALLAMALARPFFGQRDAVAAGGANRGPRSAILILDDSASMGVAEGRVTLFAKAQKSAESILGSLGSGDTASVILAGRRAAGPEVLFPNPTTDLDDVKAAVAKCRVAALGTDLAAALTVARKLALETRGERSATIFVLSDLQESGWDRPTGDAAQGDDADVSYVFVNLRPAKTPTNRAVTAVRYSATRPRVGVPFALRPMLALGKDDSKDVTVKLFVDGAKVAQKQVERLPRNKWATPRFYHTFAETGWHGGYVEVVDDSLAADDKRFFALEVPEQTQTVPILAVNGAPSSVAHQDELFFLRFALTAAPDGQKAPFSIHAIAPGEVASTEVNGYPLVVLANVAELSEAAVEKLENYVDNGGNLLVFRGDRVSPPFYNRVLAGANRRHGGLLPSTIVGEAPKEVGHVVSDYKHRAVAAFQEAKLAALLGPGLTFKALVLEAPPPSVLMKSSTGPPLLVEKAFGKGRVMLFASTCDRDWSDFPIRPGFLVWSRSIAEYLTQSAMSLQPSHRTGEGVRLTTPAGEKGTLWVKKPDGTVAAASRAGDGSGAFEWADTVEPGVYTVLRPDKQTQVGLFAVNLDSYESELEYLTDGPDGESAGDRRTRLLEELRGRLGQAPLVSYIDDPTTLDDALGKSGGARKLWDVLLLLVLLIALFEPWLANQISGRLFSKAAKPLVVPGPQSARVVETPQSIAEGVR